MTDNLYKQLKMDLFLKQIQVLSQTNKISPKQIYVQLINQGISEKEQNQDLIEVFKSLQQLNMYNQKMDVFVDSKWPYFCQFVSKNFRRLSNQNPIKIYVPLKYQNIEQSVQKIFDFINQNNIEHCSKLSKIVRVDDLVIRVYNQEDADKIINFINNDKELNNDMYSPNSFCINDGKVGLAMDRILSYNDTLSKYIYSYIEEVNSQNLFANYYGFQCFLQEKLTELRAKENLAEHIRMCDAKNIQRLPQFLQTLEEITNLIIMAMQGHSKDSIYSHFIRTNEPVYNEGKKEEYKDFDYNYMINTNYQLFQQVVHITASKYSYNAAKEALESYRNTGDLNYITRESDVREKVENSKTFKTFLSLIDIEKEVERLVPKVEVTEIEPSKEVILEEVCKTTYQVCQTPERNFCGKAQVARALIKMQANDYKSITRANNARALAQENIKPEEVRNLLKKSLEASGYIIENEADLYELYATHIEYLCNEVKRGRS